MCTILGHDSLDYIRSIARKQIPTRSSPFWHYPSTNIYFRLALIVEEETKCGPIDDDFVSNTIRGNVDDILKKKCKINLEDIFSSQSNIHDRQVVLIEGAPGCGKTTLSAHIFQQWGEGSLFQQFNTVIPLSLREPAVQAANSIEELLAVRNDLLSVTDLNRICRSDGQDVLLILDGWDELPVKMQQRKKQQRESFILALLQNLPGWSILHSCSIIVTSRPISSCDLQEIVSSRIEILGFDEIELEAFFKESLKGDTRALRVLMEKIEERPDIKGSCYLPLNANILVHVFVSNGYIVPDSMYDIFREVILACITRSCKKSNKKLEAKVFEDLPTDTHGALMYLCELAFNGMLEERFTFTSLPSIDTLGLLQGVERHAKRDKVVYYNFNHLAIQELLAAYYISKEGDNQVSHFVQLLELNQDRLLSLLQFYAAITKLQHPGVSDAVVKYVIKNTTFQSSEKDKRLLLFLLHCLYEVQDSILSRSVLQHLEKIGLNFGRWSSSVSLNPINCLYTGHFLSHVCSLKIQSDTFSVYMINCNVDNKSCAFLVRGMKKCFEGDIKTQLILNLGLNNITADGVFHVSRLLQTKCLRQLALSRNNELSDDSAHHLAEGLKNNTSLTRLVVSVCGFTLKGAKYIADALKLNSVLCRLDIRYNRFYNEGAKYFADALIVNNTLMELELENCGITDEGMEALAASLRVNTSLNKLIISNDLDGPKRFEDTRGFPLNELSKKGETAFVKSLQVNVGLEVLQIPAKPEVSEEMQTLINEIRHPRQIKDIKVISRYYPD